MISSRKQYNVRNEQKHKATISIGLEIIATKIFYTHRIWVWRRARRFWLQHKITQILNNPNKHLHRQTARITKRSTIFFCVF
jgi:hypothetical protein